MRYTLQHALYSILSHTLQLWLQHAATRNNTLQHAVIRGAIRCNTTWCIFFHDTYEWYDIVYTIHDIIYEMKILITISCMMSSIVSYLKLWCHIWYHMLAFLADLHYYSSKSRTRQQPSPVQPTRSITKLATTSTAPWRASAPLMMSISRARASPISYHDLRCASHRQGDLNGGGGGGGF